MLDSNPYSKAWPEKASTVNLGKTMGKETPRKEKTATCRIRK